MLARLRLAHMESPSSSQQSAKELAGREAVKQIKNGMVLGLGTGSTVAFFLEALSERIKSEGLSVKGIATSQATEAHAKSLDIPLVDLDEVLSLDLVIDGADEVDGKLRLIKGGGGALLREKIVAAAGSKVLIIVGEGKVIKKLGTTFLLPVEVLPFGYKATQRLVSGAGCVPFLRTQPDETPFVTDNGNYILDCKFDKGIGRPEALHKELSQIPGVAEIGLFLDLCDEVIEGRSDGPPVIYTKK